MKVLRFIPLLPLVLTFNISCDPERKSQCEWYLVPDETRIGKTDKGYIPVCARNYVSVKQDCRLQTTLQFAKKVHEKTFKYVELTVEDYGNPRTIKEIKFCSSN